MTIKRIGFHQILWFLCRDFFSSSQIGDYNFNSDFQSMDTSRRKTGRFPHFFKPFVIRSTPWPKRIRSLGFTGPRRRLGVRGWWWWSNGVWWMGGFFPVGRWRCEVQMVSKFVVNGGVVRLDQWLS